MFKYLRSIQNSLLALLLSCTLTTQVSFAATEWQSFGIGGGGGLFSASISPHDANVLYMSTDMSSVFRSQDFGQSWETVDFRRLQGGHRSTVRFTADPMILYAVNVLDELNYGVPVKSLDGGNTWSPLQADPSNGETWFLHADPNSTHNLLLANYDTLYFSADGGVTFQSIYQSSDLHIAGVFWNGHRILVGSQDGVLMSKDGGQSFTLTQLTGLPEDQAIIAFAGVVNSETTRLYAITSTAVWPGISAYDALWGYGGIYRLDWGDSAWHSIASGLAAGDGLYFLGIDNHDIQTVYAAGGNRDTAFPVVYKSTDGGDTWNTVLQTENNRNITTGWCGNGGDTDWYFPEYALSFAVSPSDGQRLMMTDLGFVHVSSDGGQSWQQAYVKRADENPAGSPTPKGRAYTGIGLQQTSNWWLHWADASTLIAAFTDIRGMRSTDSRHSWVAGSALGLPHNSTYHVIGAPDGTLYAATSSVHDLYQSTYLADAHIDQGQGFVLSSSDKGATWQTLKDLGHPVIWLALDPNRPTTLYAAAVHSSEGGIYVSHDVGQGNTWSRLAVPPRTEGHPFAVHVLNDGALVAGYSGRRDADGAFTESSGIFYSTDDGQTWQDRSDSNMLRWTKDITIDPHDATQNTWYVSVFSHWGTANNEVGGVYRSADRGQSWHRLSDLYRVESVTFHPFDMNQLYLATETQGLWFSSNIRTAQPTFQQDANYPFRHPTRIFFNPYQQEEVWVTSFGGGLRARMATQAVQPPKVEMSVQSTQATTEQPFSLSLRLSPNDYQGQAADWWLVLASAAGQSHYIKKIF